MAVSTDGRWLYLLKTNYPAGSYDFFLDTFDAREGRFLSAEQVISSCPGVRILPAPGNITPLVLCGGKNATKTEAANSVLWLENFADGQLDPMGRTLYVAGHDGSIRAVDIAALEITQTSKHVPLPHRRIMPSSGSLSPDGRLWYLPIKIPGNGELGIEQILVFDTQAMNMANVITPAGPFWGLALSSDGRWLYASHADLQSIMVIDTATRQTIRTLPIGGKPSILFVAKTP
jgi:WD40 repeat protein